MQLPEIKQGLSILKVLKYYGLQPDRNNMLKCPFHEDGTASMKIYLQTNTFNCFGCGKNGDQIEFCTLKEGSKHKGLLKAAELSGESKPINGKSLQPKALKDNHSEILTQIFESFRNGLNHPVSVKPKEYLQSRNLWPVTSSVVEMGYNSGQFHHRGALSETDKQACINAGLLIPYNGSVPNASGTNRPDTQAYTTFAKDCIIFPLKDKNGNIVSLYGRSIASASSATAPASSATAPGKHYYLKDRCGLYPNYPKPETTKLILTEAIIDAATLLQIQELKAEYEILSCYGTNGLTEEHKAAIKEWAKVTERSRSKEIVFFFDGDKAGRDAIKKCQEELGKLLPSVMLSAIEAPEGEDINSLSVTYDNDIFTHLLENRKQFENPDESGQVLKTKQFENESKAPSNLQINKSSNHTIGKLNTTNPDYIIYTTENLQIIILGGINLQQLDRLRITVKISRTNPSASSEQAHNPLHSIRHTLDLYHSDYLEKFIGKASEQLETGTNVLKLAIAELTEQIEQYRLSKIESLKEQKPQARQLSEQRQRKAINYLKAPKLMERTNHDIGKTGMIGEENNRLLMYLVFTSRLREQPLHIISLGSSGTGKTYLQEKVSELIPEQDKLEITILSENAFYYFDRKELKHKLVLIEDMDGAQEVLYPLRELQSKKKISKTIPIKDSKGNLRTITLQVEGPICLAGTTTKERLFEDNSNRSLLIYLDNSPQHKEQIMEYQRKLSAGKVNTKEENELKEFFKDMQSVLKPIKVRNPFAELLKLPEYVFKPLRTNSHYLATIETITFYHQYQREIKYDSTGLPACEAFIETTLEDIEWANKLLKDVLLAKSDELSGECRSFFERLKKWLQSEQKISFFAWQIREAFRMNPSNLKYYLVQLMRYGYIKSVGGDRYKRGFEYEVVNFEEYNKLNSSISYVFDEVLQKIKNETGRQRGQHVDNYASYPLN